MVLSDSLTLITPSNSLPFSALWWLLSFIWSTDYSSTCTVMNWDFWYYIVILIFVEFVCCFLWVSNKYTYVDSFLPFRFRFDTFEVIAVLLWSSFPREDREMSKRKDQKEWRERSFTPESSIEGRRSETNGPKCHGPHLKTSLSSFSSSLPFRCLVAKVRGVSPILFLFSFRQWSVNKKVLPRLQLLHIH